VADIDPSAENVHAMLTGHSAAFDRSVSSILPPCWKKVRKSSASGVTGWPGSNSPTYANIDSKQNVSIPQNGTGTILSGALAGTTGHITGFVQIRPAEINLKHQLSLIATIGRAFGNVALYAGGGPALFGVETNLKPRC
jgi:hypothetical protein